MRKRPHKCIPQGYLSTADFFGFELSRFLTKGRRNRFWAIETGTVLLARKSDSSQHQKESNSRKWTRMRGNYAIRNPAEVSTRGSLVRTRLLLPVDREWLLSLLLRHWVSELPPAADKVLKHSCFWSSVALDSKSSWPG